ncbi:hypothetical protein LCGC14_0888310 [marine sediment metagenome]|uniref:Uncharacterized protein n=1 Tax=marine sediment metagenome TaxID=412755 RepID=A0A0F9P4U3_9ZZZZ
MIKNKFYKENLDVDTERITICKTKESFVLTRSSGEFAHFAKLLSLMKELTIDSYHFNTNDEDEYEDEDEDEDGDEDEDIDGGSDDDVEKNDADDIELKDISSSLTTTSHIYANADIRNRGNNNSKINQTLSERLLTEKNDTVTEKKEEWYKISQPGIYEIYQLFKHLRGMDGIVMYNIKQFAQNNDESTTDKTQQKVYQELYGWCQKNFSKTLEYHILVDSFINEIEKFLQKKNDVNDNSQDHIIEINHVNSVNNNQDGDEDEDQKIDHQIDHHYFLKLIKRIKEKRKEFITYEFDIVNDNNK